MGYQNDKPFQLHQVPESTGNNADYLSYKQPDAISKIGTNPYDYNMTQEGTDGDKNSMMKLSQRENKADSVAHLSEVSFFYDNEINVNSDEED